MMDAMDWFGVVWFSIILGIPLLGFLYEAVVSPLWQEVVRQVEIAQKQNERLLPLQTQIYEEVRG